MNNMTTLFQRVGNNFLRFFAFQKDPVTNKKWTGRRLAEELKTKHHIDVSNVTLDRLIRGKIEDPRLSYIIGIALAFDMPIDEFITYLIAGNNDTATSEPNLTTMKLQHHIENLSLVNQETLLSLFDSSELLDLVLQQIRLYRKHG